MNITFKKDKRFIVPYVLRLIAMSPKQGWFEGAIKVRRHKAMETVRMNGCQETPWSEELDGKVLHWAAWWQLRSGVERICVFLHT